jgi:hypothetical protein
LKEENLIGEINAEHISNEDSKSFPLGDKDK